MDSNAHRASSVPPPTSRPPLRVVDEAPRFAQLWESVLFDDELTANAKVIYAVLQRMAYEAHGRDLAPSMRRIAERANIKDRETVAVCLRALEERGHIRRVARTKWEADIIVLTPPAPSRAEKTRNDAEETRTGHAGNIRTDHAEKTRNFIETDVETDVETYPPVVPQGTEEGEEPEKDPYTPEYEAFWRDYPRIANNSKARGFEKWKRLTPKQRRAAHTSLPAFKACKKWRVDGFVPHTSTFLSGKLFETPPDVEEPNKSASPDPAMVAWMQLVREVANPGSEFPDRRLPRRIYDAAMAVGGPKAIDPAKPFQCKTFCDAYRAWTEVAS